MAVGSVPARLVSALAGEVDDGAFVSVLAGVDPSSGVPLGRPFGEKSVRGYDVTFSAPKSVSVLAAVADPATRAEVHAAHDAAVDAVLGYVERHALTRFRVAGEVVSVDAEGIAVGVFRQHVSRELDPQLHSHAVVAAKVASPDGRWLALDARPLMADQTVLVVALPRRPARGADPPARCRLGGAGQRHRRDGRRRPGGAGGVLPALRPGRGPPGGEAGPVPGDVRAGTDGPGTVAAGTGGGGRVPPVQAAGHRRGRAAGRLAGAARGARACPPTGSSARLVGRVVEPAQSVDVDSWGPLADVALGELTDTRSTWRHPDVVRELARAVPTDTGIPAGDLVAAPGGRGGRVRGGVAGRAGPPRSRRRPAAGERRSAGHGVAAGAALHHRFTSSNRNHNSPDGPPTAGHNPARSAALEPGGLDRAQHAAAAGRRRQRAARGGRRPGRHRQDHRPAPRRRRPRRGRASGVRGRAHRDRRPGARRTRPGWRRTPSTRSSPSTAAPTAPGPRSGSRQARR